VMDSQSVTITNKIVLGEDKITAIIPLPDGSVVCGSEIGNFTRIKNNEIISKSN
jgi:hypothetical protein